jgi:hypothetical protein
MFIDNSDLVWCSTPAGVEYSFLFISYKHEVVSKVPKGFDSAQPDL